MDRDKIFNRVKILIFEKLNNGKRYYGQTLSYDCKSTYSHTTRVLREMESDGFIKSEESGRVKFVELTKKGKEIANKLQEIKELIK